MLTSTPTSSEKSHQSTLTSAFTLTRDNGTPVGIDNLIFDNASSPFSLTIDPGADYTADNYTLRISTNLKDLSGNSLREEFVLHFEAHFKENGASDEQAGMTITTGEEDDTIMASAGPDYVSAGNGNDVISAGSGNDNITAGAGNDTIEAGAGNDWIYGGAGADTMIGGADNDTFFYGATSDSSGSQKDIIGDFEANDKIDLSSIISELVVEVHGYAGAVTNPMDLIFLGDNKAMAYLLTTNGNLYIDINGDGAFTTSDMAIQLTGVTTVDNSKNFVW